MTSNQIAYFQYAEDFRHNAATEKENERHNREMEYYNTISNTIKSREASTAEYEARTHRLQAETNQRLAALESMKLAQTVRANDLTERKNMWTHEENMLKIKKDYEINLENVEIKQYQNILTQKEIDTKVYEIDTNKSIQSGRNILTGITSTLTVFGAIVGAYLGATGRIAAAKVKLNSQ